MSEHKNLEESKEVSRRSFLKKAGVLTAGITVGSGLLGALSLKDAEAAAALPFPWPSGGLDLEKVKERGVAGYYAGGCCYGAAIALINTLKEALPDSPWNTIPVDMFRFGAGGAFSWGTLCGALNGALAVINLAGGAKYGDLGNELIGWYTKAEFPNAALDVYTPNFKDQVTTVANSPLCHTSVSLWCDASGKTVNSNEKKARCAKLTGETAAKAGELLNNWIVNGNFTPVFKFDQATSECMSCHTNVDPKNPSKYDDEQGKMTCGTCHDDTLHPPKI